MSEQIDYNALVGGMKRTTEVTINGTEYLITHWSPSKNFKNLPIIGKYFAVPVATVIGSIAQGGGNFSEALPTAFLYLFDKMEEEDITKLFTVILDGVYVNGGTQVNLDKHFDGKLDELIELLAEVLKLNYECFFKKDGFASLQKLLQKLGMVTQLDNQQETQE